MTRRASLVCGCIGALLSAAPVLAHHSFAAAFDIDKPVTLTGAVTRIEWTNPHAWIYIDVTEPEKKVVNWAVETAGPNSLFRRGWSKDVLRVGDQITVDGWRAKNGSPTANARSVILPDGRRLGAGSSSEATTAPRE